MIAPLETAAELGMLRISAGGSRWTLRGDAFAAGGTYRDRIVLLASAAGPRTACEALFGGLCSNNSKAEVQFTADGFFERNAGRCERGYRVYRHRLGPHTWHVLAVAKLPGFLPAMSEEALWQHFREIGITTPILRGWLPWVVEQMKGQELLIEPDCFGCKPGVVRATTEDLDRIVSEGVQLGLLRLES